jgi:single-strand DNA-binding protein
VSDLNSTVLVGRLTRDAEYKALSSGLAVAEFSIATNRRDKSGNDQVSYFDLVLMGKAAESVHQYLTKGKQVGVTGELRQQRWESNGSARSKVQVVVKSLQLLGANPGSSRQEPDTYESDSYTDDIPF